MTSLLTRRLAAAGVALVALTGLLAVQPVPAGAADKPQWTSDNPEDGSNTAAEVMAAQEPLVDLATRITALDPDGKGLGGIRLRVADRAVDLWWKGDVPPEVKEEINRAVDGGIRVELGGSAYTQRELVDVTEALPDRWKEFPGMVDVSPAVDGSGLLVGVAKDVDTTGWDFGVPATVVRSEQVQQTSRQNDSPPWWGGAALRTPSGSCSTGFAVVRRTLWWETSRGVLTAEHCAPGGGVAVTDPTGELIGRAEPAPARRLSDSLYVPTRSGNRIYDGGVGVGEFSKPVVGAVGNFPGQFVCTSGAFSGVHCNIVTTRINALFFLSGGSFVSSGALGTQIDGRAAAGSGDSGGPVFTLTGGFSQTRAAGLIVGGLAPVGCGQFGSGCFNQVAFVDIGFVLLATESSILTS
ncbi:S1 family peptidase [Micromonospora sp. R77]|uniref:S1 family peptidase n=1 Tax=Micromonospora sp. R77 TaxID=2925836 RepID=UPI001F60D8E2|nr:S1 family peptidase [Micromonospora sp. R77]MCI4066978.1 S1 family peptidase [Micromonospora sp. R77]